jgi:hypothetical protein
MSRFIHMNGPDLAMSGLRIGSGGDFLPVGLLADGSRQALTHHGFKPV